MSGISFLNYFFLKAKHRRGTWWPVCTFHVDNLSYIWRSLLSKRFVSFLFKKLFEILLYGELSILSYLFHHLFWLCLQHVQVPGLGIEPVPQWRPESPQWQHQIFNCWELLFKHLLTSVWTSRIHFMLWVILQCYFIYFIL